MQCCPGLKGEITNSNWHLKLFPDEIEGWDNQNIFWCQLPTGTWHWHQDDRMKTGNWCGETGALMGSLTIPTVLTINAFSSCAICNFVLWKSFCFVYDAGNWSQMPPVWVYDARLHIFAETNHISDSSHPYLSTGQLGGNSYDNWKLRSDFNLRRWKNASSPQVWDVKLE